MSVNINININVNDGEKNKPKTPWKNGYFYSDKNTAELSKIDGNIVRTYSIGKTVVIYIYEVSFGFFFISSCLFLLAFVSLQ